MPNAASGKVCVMCGESCVDRPRVKDPKGRYFCRPCYDKAMARKRLMRDDDAGKDTGAGKTGAKQSSDTDTGTKRGGGALGADDWGSKLTDDLDVGDADASDATDADEPLIVASGSDDKESAAATGAGVCPNCGADFPLAAIICVECGFNTTTGHTVEAKHGGTVIAAEDAPTDTIWPSIIGVLAIVLAACFAGLSIWGLLDLLLDGGDVEGIGVHVDVDPTLAIVITSVLTLPFIIIMAWHGWAGIGLLQRRAWGYRQMKLWAKSIIIIVSVVWILLAGLVSVLALAAVGIFELLIMLLMMAVAAGVYLAWPIFLVLWLGRDRIEAEVDGWE